MKGELRHALLCALLVLVSGLATVPILEMGVNDDWSYARTARELARSGRLTYSGSGPMIGIQALWGALFIRLFGFSFTALRCSVLLLSAGSAVVLYALARRSGLRPRFAIFASLTVLLSPLVIPLSSSFMTDVPALFLLLVAIYCGMRALEAAGRRQILAWTVASVIAGFAGGTIRQIVWAAPLLLIPTVAWLQRKDQGLVRACAAAWGAAALAIALCLYWFQIQPYALPLTPAHRPATFLRILQAAPGRLDFLAFELSLFLLPVLACHWRGWRKRPALLPAVTACLGVFAALGGAIAGTLGRGSPLLGNIVTAWGVLTPGTEALGSRPLVLGRTACLGLAALVLASCAVALTAWLSRLFWERHRAGLRSAGLNRFLQACGPFGVCYVLILFFGNTAFLDRYLILLLPILVVPVLWSYQEYIRDRIPAPGWVALAVYAWYGVAATHDYLAAARARLQAASAVVASGVPRTSVTAGFEYDAWTQLERSGHIDDPRIKTPARTYRPVNRAYPTADPYWFWRFTPDLDPRYFVVYSEQPGLAESSFAPVEFRTWLPPFQRRVLIQVPAETASRR